MTAPLDGILVVDFSQFLAGPYASLKLLDLGARVIKVENPDRGDLCRYHYTSDTDIAGNSTLFHAINRGKQSIALDLKTARGLSRAKALVTRADVVIQNFRPGVMARLGLDYPAARQLRPDVIYGSISGYGPGPAWRDAPGQDLLAQARSGIMWLSGDAADGPVPVGLPVADISAGATLAQGLLGALYRRAMRGEGALVETSLLEALVDLQFEFLSTYLNNGRQPPRRLSEGSAHAYLAAPYGVYETRDGHLALAMTALEKLAGPLDLRTLRDAASSPERAFRERDEIRALIQDRLRSDTAAHWEERLADEGIWCARVMGWPELLGSPAFADLGMVALSGATSQGGYAALRPPLRLDGRRGEAEALGPALNADYRRICEEFGL